MQKKKKKKRKKKGFQALQSNEDKNSTNTIYDNLIQAHWEAAKLPVSHKPRNKKSLWGGKNVIEKRTTLQDVLKGTSEEVSPKAWKIEDAKKDHDRAYVEEQEEHIKGKIQENERTHESYKTSLTWSIVNKISAQKGSSHGWIRAVQRSV